MGRQTEKAEDKSEKEEYKPERRRWLIVFVIMMASITANIVYCTLQPISIPVAKAFNLDTVFYVNLTISMQMFLAAPMTFVSIYFYSRFSMSSVLRCVVTLYLVGCAIRVICYFHESFWPVAVG